VANVNDGNHFLKILIRARYTRHNSRAYSKRLKISRPKEAETPRRHVVVPSLRISPAPLHLS
jgi:hypothetical protein